LAARLPTSGRFAARKTTTARSVRCSARPSWLERLLVIAALGVFFNAFFALYLLAPKSAHRFVGYIAEEAVISYTHYLAEIDAGRHANVAAPAIAIRYWNLAADARLREVVAAARTDEAIHRDVNHASADALEASGAKRPEAA
jgi:ubiquinol oxidase